MYSKLRIVHELSNVSSSTLHNWFHGETRNPQHHTVMAVITALGYEEQFVKIRENFDLDNERKKANAWTVKNYKPNGKGKNRKVKSAL